MKTKLTQLVAKYIHKLNAFGRMSAPVGEMKLVKLTKYYIDMKIDSLEFRLILLDGLVTDKDGNEYTPQDRDTFELLNQIRSYVPEVLADKPLNSVDIYVITDGEKFIGTMPHGAIFSTTHFSKDVFFNDLKEAVDAKLKWISNPSNLGESQVFSAFSVKQYSLMNSPILNDVYLEYVRVCKSIEQLNEQKHELTLLMSSQEK